jgi:spermidine synthase
MTGCCKHRSCADFQSRQMGDNRTIGPLLQSLPAPANSDFYPFIDLNAPRSRYLRETAIELPALTVLPIPFFELIGAAVPAGPTVEPAANSALFRDGLVHRALQIRDAVSTGSLNGLDPVIARDLGHIDMSPEQCAAESGQNDWQNAVRRISDATTSYLKAGELEGIWHKVMASPCYRDTDGERRAWVDLLAATADRDAAQITRLGAGLLGSQAAESEEDLAYLTTVTVAAYIRLGDTAQARRLLQAQWSRVNHAGKFAFALRALAALTRSAQ